MSGWGGHANGRIPADQLGAVTATYYGRPATFLLRADAANSLQRLVDMSPHYGHGTDITDCYRPYAVQVALRQRWCARGKCAYAAVPGTSNHGWGLAADMAHSRQAGLARFAHAHPRVWREHGWIWPDWARPPGVYEPWHWEYRSNLDQHRDTKPDRGKEDDDMIRQGDRGDHVAHVQRLVNGMLSRSARLGDYPSMPSIAADGVYGPETVRAATHALGRSVMYTDINLHASADPLSAAAQAVLALGVAETARRLARA